MRYVFNSVACALHVGLLICAASQAFAVDTDGDGTPDAADNCIYDANPSQCDTDNDGYGNRCDGDLNQNGVVDGLDQILFDLDLASGTDSGIGSDLNCDAGVGVDDLGWLTVLVARNPPIPGPSNSCPLGSLGCLDLDQDGVYDSVDNCLGVANPTQCDEDGDGFGNHCDGDLPTASAPLGDGAVGLNDLGAVLTDLQQGTNGGLGTDLNCDGAVGVDDLGKILNWSSIQKQPGPSALPCAGSADCVDSDHDSLVDGSDNCSEIANVDQADVDENGVGDVCEIWVQRRSVMSDWMDDGWASADPDQSRFEVVSLADGRMAGFYVAGLFDGPIEIPNYLPGRVVNYFEEVSIGGPIQTIQAWQVPADHSFIGNSLDVVRDRIGRACAAFGTAPSAGNPTLVVACRTPNGFDVKLAGGSAVNLRTMLESRLSFDSANYPVLVFYQHGLIDGYNHRVRFLRFDGTGWIKETLAIPSSLGFLDGRSDSPCIVVDDTNQAHVIFAANQDDNCVGCPSFVDSAIVYTTGSVTSPTTEWLQEVVADDLLIGLNAYERAECSDITIAPDGTLHAVYKVEEGTYRPPSPDFPETPNGLWTGNLTGEIHHLVKSGAIWEDTKVDDGYDWDNLNVDDAGNLYGVAGTSDKRVLLKVLLKSGPHAGLHSTELPLAAVSYAPRAGISLFLRESSAGGDAVECVLADAAVRESPYFPLTMQTDVMLLTIDSCDDAFLGVPVPDF